MTDDTEHETREVPVDQTQEVSGDHTIQRGWVQESVQDVLAFVQAAGGPTAVVGATTVGAVQIASRVTDVIVARTDANATIQAAQIQADAQVEVARIDAEARVEIARIEHGESTEGGAHRAEE